MNLLDMLKDELGGTLASQASSFLGESSSNTQSALSGILPILMGGLTQKSSTATGATALFDMLKGSNFDGGMLSNLSGLLGGGDATTGLINSGNGIVKMLMGNKLGGVLDLLTSFSGMKRSSSSSLLSMAAPLIMSFIGKQVMKKGLNASGLASLLGGQAKHIQNAMPAGLSGVSDLLGFADLGKGNIVENAVNTAQSTARETASTVRNTAANVQTTAKKKSGGLFPWILGLLALLGLGWFLQRGCAGDAMNAVETVTEKTVDAAKDVAEGTKNVVENTVDAAGGALDAATSAAREALSSISFTAGSVGEKFYTFIKEGGDNADAVFRFNNLTFDTGSAAITAETVTEVDNLAAVLKAYPNVNIEVSGHTDSTGSAEGNKTLSQQRAESVKARLAEMGIAADRISTVGYGAEKPTATNDTAEGRAENRRIEVRITSK